MTRLFLFWSMAAWVLAMTPHLQVGVALDLDVEATVAGLDPALFGHAQVVGVDIRFAVAGRYARCAIAERRDAHGHACPGAFLLAVEAAAVLQAFDGKLAADVGRHALAGHHRALERGVAAAVDAGDIARLDMGVDGADVGAVGVPARLVGGQFQREAVLLATHRKADTDRGAAGVVLAVLADGVLRGCQRDLVVGLEVDVVAGADVGGNGGQVAAGAGAGGGNADVATRIDPGADGGAGRLRAAAFALAAAEADADLDAAHAAAVSKFLRRLQRGLGVHGGIDPCQRLHTAVAGVLGGVGHALDALHGADERNADRAADGDLAVGAALFGIVDVIRFVDQDIPGVDVDIALGGEHAAGGLRVLLAGLEGDVAAAVGAQAGDLAAHLRDAVRLAILGLLDGADCRLPEAADEAAGLAAALGLLRLRFLRAHHAEVAAGKDIDIGVGDDGAALDFGVASAGDVDVAAADAAADGLRLRLVGILHRRFAGEQRGAHMRVKHDRRRHPHGFAQQGGRTLALGKIAGAALLFGGNDVDVVFRVEADIVLGYHIAAANR